MRQESEGCPSKSKQHSCEAAVTELGPDNSPSLSSRILFLPFTTYFRTKDLLALKSCLRLVLAAVLLTTTLAWAITDLTPSSGPPFCILRPRRTVLSLTPPPPLPSLLAPARSNTQSTDSGIKSSTSLVAVSAHPLLSHHPLPQTADRSSGVVPPGRNATRTSKSNIQHPHNSQLLHICDVSAIGSPTIRTPALHSARQCVHFNPSSLF